jgi:xylan 1,4-beta-xylosidase
MRVPLARGKFGDCMPDVLKNLPVSRREALALGLSLSASSIASTAPLIAGVREWRRDTEGRRVANLGDGTYLNPVLAGDHPDPTILRDGNDYYATFSSFDATPGLLIWHSQDLIDWRPLKPALQAPLGIVFAPDLGKVDGRYYLYIPFIPASWSTQLPQSPSIWVIHADSPHGPWSEPIDLGLRNYIDPGHIVAEDGRRYLFLSGGSRVRLSADGLSVDGPVEKAYDGWKYPDDWITEAYALEGPKLFRRGEFFYLVSAVGGTSGPPTGHMVIVARSRSVLGPWENCPHNPLVRTTNVAERWWSRGHATVFEGPKQTHWMVYHGYENGYRSLGRQLLLEPIQWDADGWFHAKGGDLSRPLPAPMNSSGGAMPAWSDDFSQPAFGTRWNFFAATPAEPHRASFEIDSMVLEGKGTDPATCSPLLGYSGDLSYECSVSIQLIDAVQGGLLLFFNQQLFLGMGFDGEQMFTYQGGKRSFWREPAPKARALHLRIRNERQIVSFFYSEDGQHWTRHGLRSEVSGYNANTMSDLQSLRPAICAIGTGKVRLRNYRYRGLAW